MYKCSRSDCRNGRVFLESQKRFVPCPECTGVTNVLKRKDPNENLLVDTLMIPEQYQTDESVTIKELINESNIRGFSVPQSLSRVEEYLDELKYKVSMRDRINLSTYINLPTQVNINSYVFNLQLEALGVGMKVSPFIDLNTLNGIRRASDFRTTDLERISFTDAETRSSPEIIDAVEGIKFIEHTKMTFSDLVSADLCIVRATSNTQERGWNALGELLDLRDRYGKATIVFGYWRHKARYTGGLRYLINEGVKRNALRLLTVYEVETGNGNPKTNQTRNSKPAQTKRVNNLNNYFS